MKRATEVMKRGAEKIEGIRKKSMKDKNKRMGGQWKVGRGKGKVTKNKRQ